MKRRRFLQAIAVAPAAPVATVVAQQAAPPAPAQPPAAPPGRGGGPRGGQAAPPLETTVAELSAEAAAPTFFKPEQYAALRQLGSLLQPPLNGHPGALEAGVPEFLDFLIGASPVDRQKLYRDGLDSLNAQARKQFNKSFSDLDTAQADTVLRPLLAVIPWSEDLPKDPARHFMAQAQRDFRAATQNSREWATAGATSGRRGRGFGGGVGLYWLPIDPVVKG